jgi:chemotaxis signal transduction protein
VAADGSLLSSRAAELRDAFDRSFAGAPAESPPCDDFLDVRLGPVRHALRVSEMAGLLADVRIAPLPSPIGELLGIAGLRGAILPVYDLRALLGYSTEAPPRWVAIAAAAPVAFAFDAFERHLRVRRDAVVPHADGGSRHVREVVRLDEGMRPIVSIASVLDVLEAMANRVRGERVPGKSDR